MEVCAVSGTGYRLNLEPRRALWQERCRHAPALQDNILSQKSIGAEGAHALAEAVRWASALEVFFVTQNSIDDDGARALAEALPRAPALKMLYLYTNRIGDGGARAGRGAVERGGTGGALSYSKLDA